MRWPSSSRVPLVLLAVAWGFLAVPGFAGPHAVLSGGGGSINSAGFRATVTLGQTFAGAGQSAGFRTGVGFAPGLEVAGPTGAVQAATVVQNSSALVTAQLVDDNAVLGATLFFRMGGDVVFTPLAMTEVAAGEWQASIPAGSVTVRGVQYYVEATDGLNVSAIPLGAPGAGTASLAVTVNGHPAFSLGADTYALLGTPLVPASSDPAAVFDELGAYDPVQWRHFTFDPAASLYNEHPASVDVVPGRGFWTIARNARTIQVSGTSTNVGADFVIQLAPGFNQIASPFAFPVDFAAVIRPGSVENNLIGFDGSGYLTGRTVLEPGKGYWLRNTSGSTQQITIPPRGAGTSPALAAVARPSDLWKVTARATAGAYTDASNAIGLRADATPAQDAFDFSEPPVPPGGYVGLAFVSDRVHALMTDYRGVEAGATWEMRLTSDQAGTPYSIALGLEGTLPAGHVFAMFERETGARVPVENGSTLTGVVGAGGWSRSWILVAGPPGYVEGQGHEIGGGALAFRVGSPYPNPLPAGRDATVELDLPRRDRVSVTVHDLQGRRVRTLQDGMLEQGVHRLAWSGSDDRNHRLNAGVYFLRVDAGAGGRVDRKVVLIR